MSDSADSLVKQLLDAGVHYGHKASHWNPKMGPYIFGKRHRIHIIDVRETIKGLILAKRFLTRVVSSGKDVLFVGTKRQAKLTIEPLAAEVEMPCVTERWLGGTLTNFRTIRDRLKRLEELETLMDGDDWGSYSKKMASQLTRERKKIHRNLSGIRNMDKLPGAMVAVDVRREVNGLREAKKLGIPTVCLIDTNSDPDLADIPIPANDDAMRAIEIVIRELCSAVTEGKTARAQAALEQQAGDDDADRPRRRSTRSQFRADEEDAAATTEEGETTTPGEGAAPSEGAAPGEGDPQPQAVAATTPQVSEPTASATPAATPATTEAAGESPAS